MNKQPLVWWISLAKLWRHDGIIEWAAWTKTEISTGLGPYRMKNREWGGRATDKIRVQLRAGALRAVRPSVVVLAEWEPGTRWWSQYRLLNTGKLVRT